VFTLVPATGHIGSVRSHPIAFFATTLSALVGDALFEPVTNGSLSHVETAGDLFGRQPLFSQFNQLLIAI